MSLSKQYFFTGKYRNCLPSIRCVSFRQPPCKSHTLGLSVLQVCFALWCLFLRLKPVKLQTNIYWLASTYSPVGGFLGIFSRLHPSRRKAREGANLLKFFGPPISPSHKRHTHTHTHTHTHMYTYTHTHKHTHKHIHTHTQSHTDEHIQVCRTRGVVEHYRAELQSKRSNPNARWQLGVRKEAAPSPPNHGVDEFLTYTRQVTSSGQDWGLVFRVVLQGPRCPARKILYWGPMLQPDSGKS
jgi:hypothetical protein